MHKKLLVKHLFTAAGIFILTLSCTKETIQVRLVAKEARNQAYGNDPAQKMDVYLPASRSFESTGIMVLVHGGGWNSGDKSDFDAYIDIIKEKKPGYALFNLNYRLANNSSNIFPAQENDIKQALEYIISKRQEFLISEEIILLGASAGAHLALLQAYKYNTPVKPKAVISFFGPTDLTALYENASNPAVKTLLNIVTGSTPAKDPDIYFQASPLNFVSNQSPPTLILQGGLDILVPSSQAELLQTKLASFAVPHRYIFYPNEGHGWTGESLNDSFDRIDEFLRDYVE